MQTYGGDPGPDIHFDDFGAIAPRLQHRRRARAPALRLLRERAALPLHRAGAGANTVVRIDELAVGDPVEFSLTCVDHQLPDMLRHCGVADLADQVAEPARRRARRGRPACAS